MEVSRGVVTYGAAREWWFRRDCFDGRGCDPANRVPLVNESFGPGRWRAFRAFLSASAAEAEAAARAAGVECSEFLASVGCTLEHQVRALRYRTVVRALLSHGWRAVRLCLEHGVTDVGVCMDPVFAVGYHLDILEDIAVRIANDGPWERPAALDRLGEFFRAFLYRVSRPLSETWSPDLVLYLYDREGTRDCLSDAGLSLCISAAWDKRRDRFDGVCESLGVARKNAVYEAYRQGCEGAFEETLTLSDERVRYLAFTHAFHCGRDDEAIALAATLADEYARKSLACKCLKRMAELERIVTSLLVERMRMV